MKEATDKLVEKVKSYIKRNKMIVPGSHVVVGVSGGPDSMCLLHILYRVREEQFLTLHAVHINHGLRGGEADEDQLYVENWCALHNIGFHGISVNVNQYAEENKVSIEEAGRELRYAEFRKYAQIIAQGQQTSELKARNTICGSQVLIAVAQNLNDQAETVLMRVIRGTGLDGLTGMEPINGNIIRPLLETSREEIEEYCLRNGIRARIDRTNLETVYTRNKIRLECIPYIRDNFNPNIITGLSRMASVLKEDCDFLQLESKKAFQLCIAENMGTKADKLVQIIEIDLDKLQDKHPAIKKRVLRLAIEQVKGDLKGIEAGHINDLLELADMGATGSELHLPHNLRASKSYRKIIFFVDYGNEEKGNKKCSDVCILNIPGETRGPGGEIKIISSLIDLNGDLPGPHDKYFSQHPEARVQYFDYDKVLGISEGVTVRTREDGDTIRPSGMRGTKKLKDYFIDNKVPRNIRDTIPLIAAGKEIIWITGFRASEKFKADINTNTILRIEIQ